MNYTSLRHKLNTDRRCDSRMRSYRHVTANLGLGRGESVSAGHVLAGGGGHVIAVRTAPLSGDQARIDNRPARSYNTEELISLAAVSLNK